MSNPKLQEFNAAHMANFFTLRVIGTLNSSLVFVGGEGEGEGAGDGEDVSVMGLEFML